MYQLLQGVIVVSADHALPFEQPIRIVRRSTVILDGYIIDSADSPVDITGDTVLFSVKHHAADDGYGIINSTATIINGPSGHWQLILSSADTDIAPASYVYQVTHIEHATNKRNYPVPLSAFKVTSVLQQD